MAYFTQSKAAPQLEFCRQLAKDLIDYSYKAAGVDRRKRKRSEAADGIGLWRGKGATFCWKLEWRRLGSTVDLVPTTCLPDSTLQKRIRTYCKCMIGHWLCPTCIGIHVSSKSNDK